MFVNEKFQSIVCGAMKPYKKYVRFNIQLLWTADHCNLIDEYNNNVIIARLNKNGKIGFNRQFLTQQQYELVQKIGMTMQSNKQYGIDFTESNYQLIKTILTNYCETRKRELEEE